MGTNEIIKKLEEMGFKDVQVVEFEQSEDDFGEEHTHDVPTIHHILSGELIIQTGNNVISYKPGEVVEFAAGTRHAAKGGPNGCKMIVGFK